MVDLSFASTELKTKVEPVVLPIIYEEKREEDMAKNLRINFKKIQRKHLSKSITLISHPAKKPYPKILCSKPILVIAPTPEPLTATAGSNPPPSGRLLPDEGATHPESERPSTGLYPPSSPGAPCPQPGGDNRTDEVDSLLYK